MEHTLIKTLLIASLMLNAYFAGATGIKPAQAYDTAGLGNITAAYTPIEYIDGGR